jgi:hypothetical protein
LVFTLAFSWYYLPDVREFLHWCQENFPYMEEVRCIRLFSMRQANTSLCTN